jgi:ABC-2 type transport system permease protein
LGGINWWKEKRGGEDMKKTFLVMKNELITIFKSPSYLIMAFGIPVLAVLILGIVSLIQSDSDENIADEPTSSVVHFIETEGYIDHSGLIQIIPDNLKGKLLPYKTEDKAADALENGDISAYYIIPKDYLESGKVEYVYPNDKSF